MENRSGKAAHADRRALKRRLQKRHLIPEPAKKKLKKEEKWL